jgi:LuxR family maltose regulon positive regulatory protein
VRDEKDFSPRPDFAPDNSSSQACLIPPRLADPLIERNQLLAPLTQFKNKVVLLLGAAGSGKTFALVGLYETLKTRGEPVAWLTLSSADNTEATLNEKLVLLALQAPHAPLLIDGGEKITADPAWSRLEDFALKASETRTVYLTAQTMRRSALYDGWLRGTVETIGPDRLHMGNEEVAALLGEGFNDAEIDTITRAVQGWPAALRLLSRAPETARAIANAQAGVEVRLPLSMSMYFDDVVIPRLAPDDVETLTSLAVLERFTSKMLPAMPPPACDWQSVQALLHHGNYLLPLDQTFNWIEVNPAFGQHLRGRVQHRSTDRFERLKEFAASWCADNGFAAEAVRHARQLRDPKRAAEIIEHAGAIVVELTASPALDLTLDLPPQRVRDLPLLFFSQIYHRIRHARYRQARMAYDKGFAITGGFTEISPNADPLLVAAWVQIFKILFASIDDVRVSHEDIEYAEGLMIECLDQHPSLAAAFASVIVWAHIENGHIEQANRICHMVFDPTTSVIKITLFLHVHWSNLLLMDGTIASAIYHIEQAQTLAQIECGTDSYEVLIPQLKRGILYYEQDQLPEASTCLLPALGRLRTINGWVRIYGEALTVAVAVEIGLGNHDRAEAQLRAGEQFAVLRELPRLKAILATERAHLKMNAGDYRAARDLLESPQLAELLTYSGTDGYTLLPRASVFLANARLHIELNRPREALTILAEMGTIFACNPDARLRFIHHVLSMRASFDLRRYNSAVEHMLAALDVASTTGLVRRAREQATPLLTVYDWAKRNGKAVPQRLQDFVCQVLSCGEAGPRPPEAPFPREKTSVNRLALSPREAEIITLVAEGLSAKEIALRLGISEGTVKSHRKKIHDKLGVSSRSQAILKARELLII